MKSVSFLLRLYYDLHQTIAKCFPRFYNFIFLYRKIFKYVFSGGLAAIVNLSTLFILTDFFDFWYLFSTTIAYTLAFFVSFCFQKFWTFKDMAVSGIHAQATMYLIVGLINLVVNVGLMFALVDWLKVWYLAAQVIVSGSIAIITFFVYKNLVFNQKTQ